MLAAAVLLLPLPASGGLIWNLGAALGYASLAFAVVLYLYPLRGEGIAHRRLFTVSQHRRIGWITLSLAALHTAILLVAQPLTGHYLLPSAPLYMLCGVAALVALAVLVPTGISARSALRRAAAPRKSSADIATHVVLAGLLLGLLAAHIVGSGQLLDRQIRGHGAMIRRVTAVDVTSADVTSRGRSQRSRRRRSLPDPVRGSAATSSIDFGTL